MARVYKHALVNKATAATHTIVAAVTGHKLVVVAYALVAAGSQTAAWKDSAGTPIELSGAMTMATGVPIVCPECSAGWFRTTASKALTLVLSGTVQVSGHVVYYEE